MSSIRKSAPRREHKERAQPKKRAHHGLLEKHKDYVLRARDYHSKQKRLKALKLKADFRNPDEFYFGMIKSKTKDGVHIAQRNECLPIDTVKLLKSQDLAYIVQQRNIERKKIEKLRNTLHLLDVETSDPETSTRSNNHIIFVEDEQELKNFNPEKHFETPSELLSRKFNRPRAKDLEKNAFADIDEKSLNLSNQARAEAYEQLSFHIEREKQLAKAERELIIQKNLMSNGSKTKIGVDENGLGVYKWSTQRNK